MDNVGNYNSNYLFREAEWSRICHALAGNDCIKGEGALYLPKPEAMNHKQYAAYKQRAVFYPVADRTLNGLTGLVFRHQPIFELPEQLESYRETATVDGNPLNILAENIIRSILSVGRFGMLPDFAPNATSTDIPHIATYNALDICDWNVELINGKHKLVRVELRDMPDTDTEERLELALIENIYTVRRWVSSHEKVGKSRKVTTTWHLAGETTPIVNGRNLDYIPFIFINTYDLLPSVTKPPMLDLVDMNIAHYQNSADYEHALFMTAQATPWVSGAFTKENEPKTIGAGSFWTLPPDAKVGMLEFSGVGIAAQRTAMEDKKNDMASLGARMIFEGQVRNEASDTARMRGRSELALLGSAVNVTEAALKKILGTCAEWIGGSKDDVTVKLNRDWIETRMVGKDIKELVAAWQGGAISYETLYSNLQKGEIASIERTSDEEKDLIETEGGDMSLNRLGNLEMEEEDDGDIG